MKNRAIRLINVKLIFVCKMCDECNLDVTSALYLCNVEPDRAPPVPLSTIFKTYTTLKSVKCALKRQVSNIVHKSKVI